jgi:hypothetical protein
MSLRLMGVPSEKLTAEAPGLRHVEGSRQIRRRGQRFEN